MSKLQLRMELRILLAGTCCCFCQQRLHVLVGRQGLTLTWLPGSKRLIFLKEFSHRLLPQ